MAFVTSVRTACPVAVVELHGELDMDTRRHLQDAVEQVLRAGCTSVAIDLSDVRFLDCCALGALVGAAHRVEEARGELLVTAASPQVRRLLELTGTDWLTDSSRSALAR